MRYSVFSVISPEGCAAILWNDPAKQESATKAMKITAEDLKSYNLIDAVIEEPLIGAHRDKDAAVKAVGEYVLTMLQELENMSESERLEARYNRITSVGAYNE
jgi:acetyl-CoA carboxylase carboxyl transferase subunit alpha